MKYRESNIDKSIRSKFAKAMNYRFLKKISLVRGNFRGLNKFEMEFGYPITAIAGKNGSGKSSILALACCAYHNGSAGFRLSRRNQSYYTFKDFFIRHRDEPKQRTVRIDYHIAHNAWKPNPTIPDGVGVAMQSRRKNENGRWNDYDARMRRTVVYFGIERVVPHYERSQSRSYSSSFAEIPVKGWEVHVAKIVGNIMGKTYTKFRYLHHGRYALPVVECDGVIYSGFNMGAGENALFEIFSAIFECEPSTMIVIDEIELGLHVHAQRKLIAELKGLCETRHLQIICTTHSRDVLAALPPDARFFLERVEGKTKLTPAISADFASAKMAHDKSGELDIFVEDDVASALLHACLPATLRTRISITIIGSATAIARQLAAAYMRKETRACIAILDGDQRLLEKVNLAHAKAMAENPGADFTQWIETRMHFLPGETWPEAWLIDKARDCTEQLGEVIGAPSDEVAEVLEYAAQAGKHSEFSEAGQQLGLSRIDCMNRFAQVIAQSYPEDFEHLRERIANILAEGL